MLLKIRFNWQLAILVLIGGFFLIYCDLSLWQHRDFRSAAFDLGIFDQAVWQISNLHTPWSSFRHLNLLGDHFSPILLLLAPIYWLWSSPEALLCLQALGGGLSLLPLVLIAEDVWHLDSQLKNVVFPIFGLVYLTYIGLQDALLFDFHPETMMISVFSTLLLAVHFSRRGLFWFMYLLILITKEEMALVLFLLGIYLWLVKKERRWGLTAGFLAISYFLLVVFVIMPLLNGGFVGGGYLNFTNLGSSPWEILRNGFLHPNLIFREFTWPLIKVKTLIDLLLPFLFLPLFSLISIMLSLPLLAGRFLSVSPLRWGLGFHYYVTMAPILTLGMIYSLKRLSSLVRHPGWLIFTSLGGMLLVSLYLSFKLSSPLQRTFLTREAGNPYARLELESVLAHIPEGASVSAQSGLAPHLSHRKEIFQYPDQKNYVEYIVVTLERTTYPLLFPEMVAEIEDLKKDAQLELIVQQGNTYLFKRISF